MKKSLLSLMFAVLAAGTLKVSAQEGKKLLLSTDVKNAVLYKNAAKSSSASQIASTSCGVDTLMYPYLKELKFNAPNDTFYVDAMVGNVRTASQAYINNSPVAIKGIQFWGGAYSNGTSAQTLQVKLILYSVNATFQPTLALDSSIITVTQNMNFYEGLFNTPYTVNGNFAVGVKNVPNDTVAIITNNAGASWQNPSYGEGLAWRRFGSGTWNSSLSFFGQDLEYMIFPIVSHTISSSFASSTTTICPNTTVTFTNTSTGNLTNRMFNLYTFDDYWNFAPVDSTFKWNYGTNTVWTTSVNGAYTYTSGGTYTASLSAKKEGYYTACLDTASVSIFVKPSYSQTVSAAMCAGDTYTMGSQTYTAAGVYTQSLTSPYTCDSLVTLNLTTNTVNVGVTAMGLNLIANASGATYQWINCAASNTPIAGATSQTFAATANGNYAVIVTQNNCSDTSACTAITTVGLKNNSISGKISIHPNPSTGSFTVQLGNVVADNIIVRDMLGRELKTIQPEGVVTSVDLSSFPSSVYFVTVVYGRESTVVKVVKQ